ncbi:MAG: flagellar biosynthetic protein FliO [Bauldia sp.]|nr:flagellar biosynthetic protein FliO [Bauldia sp.]
MLEPILGGTGAVVAQYVITLVVILALVALVVWLVRRYAVGGVGTTARGRLPRLAIVDALVVDNRHRLVLVRRDNVEHLVLIGGATDLLIEPSIVRTRLPQRPGQTPQPTPPTA